MKKVRLTSVEWADENPNMAGDMPNGSSHYKCKLRRGNKQITIYFSMGPAHSLEPTARELLECLASDATIHENDEYDELGIGHRAAGKCEKQAERFKLFMGSDYESLIWGDHEKTVRQFCA